MVTKPLYKLLLGVYLTILAIFTLHSAYGQMPPSSRLLEKIRRGEIEVPYCLKNADRIKRAEYALCQRIPAASGRRNTMDGNRMRWGPESPMKGKWNTLVLLVDFPDKHGYVRPAFFDSLVFGNRFGSFRDYYRSLSFNALDIVTVNPPGAIGWVTVPHPYSYYVNQDHGWSTNYPHNVQGLVEDILHAADPSIDFSKYDNDHDSYVDGLFLVHAGSGAEYTGNNDDMWASVVGPQTPQVLDGVTVSRCALVPEYYTSAEDMTVGVFAHEFGHTGFNLPDMYDVDQTSEGLGQWSLMGSGSWNGPTPGGVPALPDAWCRVQMGYAQPIIVADDITAAPIPSASQDSVVYKLQRRVNPGSEYFLVENRQQTDYDAFLPGNGLLIYHIDDTVSTIDWNEWCPGNEANGHYLSALEQADEAWELENKVNRGNAGDPFPGSTGAHSFSAWTAPNSNDYAGGATGIAITNIGNSAPVMTADLHVKQNNPAILLITPNGGERWPLGFPEDITWASSFVTAVKIELSTDDGSTWTTIVSHAPAAIGKYAWVAPGPLSKHARVRISDSADASVSDMSDAAFALNATRTLVEEEPNNYGDYPQYLAYGDSVDGSIDPEGDLDYYSFSASCGDTVEISAYARDNSTLNGMLWLYNDAWAAVANNDDLGSWALARIVYVAPKSGVYLIRFSANDNWNALRAGTALLPAEGDHAGSGIGGLPPIGIIAQQTVQPNASPIPLPSSGGDRIGALSSRGMAANTGAYRICVRKFVPSPPMIFSSMTYDTYSDATQFSASICPNGRAWVAFEYGKSTAYENVATLPYNPYNGFYGMVVYTALIRNLAANTTYHYRTGVWTDRDSALSADDLFVTPAGPSGWEFQARAAGYALRSCSFVNAASGCIAGTSGKILRTDNGGKSWISQTSPASATFYAIAMTDVRTATAVGESGTIVHTTDGGMHWSAQASGTQAQLFGISFVNADTGTVVGDWGTILKTTDGGAHWLTQNSGTNKALFGVSFTGPLHGAAVGDVGTILRTIDGGAQWLPQTGGTDKPLYNVAFADPNTGIAVGGGGTILKTLDGGETWSTQQSGTAQWLEGLSFTDVNSAIATGGSGTILRTTNGGTVWSVQGSGTYNNILGVSFSDRLNGTAVGEYGVILRTVLPEAVALTEAGSPKEYALLQNYPNPFNPTTTIRYALPAVSHVKLTVYDILGREVQTLVNQLKQPGRYEAVFEAGCLASGVYFYQLQAGRFVAAHKLVVLR